MGGGGGALLSTNKFDGKGGGRLPMAHAATMVALLFSTPCIVSLSPSLPPVALLSTVARHGLLSGTGHRELGVRSAAATVAAAQAQQAPKTDPAEVAALNTILGRWGKKASSEWNISGEPCSGYAIDKTDWDYYPNINPFIKCDCTDSNNTVCHITKLRVTKLDVVGQIPTELQNLTHLVDLNFNYNYLTGAIPSFIGIFTSMKYLALAMNPLSGPLPKELGNLTNLVSLGISLDNFTGGLPEELGNLTKLRQLRASDNGFIGKIPDYLGSMTNLQDIAFQGNSFEGPIPQSLSNLTKLTSLLVTDFWKTRMSRRIGDIVDGNSSLAFIGNMTSLSELLLRNCKISGDLRAIDFSKFEKLILLDLSFNKITGQVPQSILNLGNLQFLFLGNNSLTGMLPDGISSSLKAIALPSGLNCLQQDIPCLRESPEYYSFAIDCGSKTALRGSDNTIYEADSINLGAASYYVTDLTRWGVSSVGNYFQATDGNNIISSPQHFQNVVDSELFETARMSPSSLRYYGLGLENGNYTVVLQFAEFAFPDSQTWLSLGRRVFDIYVQISLLLCEMAYQKGNVKQGKLPDGRVIAVKQLSQSSHQGTNQFVTEVATISAVQHRNLVRLHGCCIDSKTPLLVYEYLENGSLDRAIFGQNSFNLDWATRFEIILGIARGLTYLHEESSVRIVHRDIKASNILLDIDLTPKISDFGLAKLYDENQTHVSTGIAGTIGYLAPEYAMRGRLTEKADVFAFGVVWGLYEKDQALRIVEPSLKDFDKDEVFRVICVALLCTQGSPHQRPPMSKVVAMLTGDVDVVKVVTKPSYITEWQLRGGGNCSYKGYTNPEFDRQKEITRDCLHGR
ncbi:hypothetical protein OsJ_17834 [Oryza sativa Japonica Group]|uniref:non-specific serine/threonine protein kinase n=1 Tax=Oryza sativa subsp. japonica TaxID=39947 RepID=B9FNJ1_ORYSJ|nr:hypothetical protein OsJ_17834 [Oryza sativa Japonica Group]